MPASLSLRIKEQYCLGDPVPRRSNQIGRLRDLVGQSSAQRLDELLCGSTLLNAAPPCLSHLRLGISSARNKSVLDDPQQRNCR